MAKQKYWNGSSWEVIGSDAGKVDVTDSANFYAGSTVEGALAEIGAGAMRQLRTAKSSKDANGIYTVVEYRRKTDNTLFARSTLSGGTAPQYTTRTITYYSTNGSTVLKTDSFTINYDSDGDWFSEV
ncbi:hypothetical protein [Bacillus sp. MMSF_3328]|uniref:hypothetical protein n=1 Tax=Bacillus sp. MMSF_3328 TaxID=3047080 RepID=UPI00273E1361|nr:hypothetical protein [Bacillus sp. MMSF_3328]